MTEQGVLSDLQRFSTMTRTQIIKSLSVQETILNALNAQRIALEGKLNWVAGEEQEETKAFLENVKRALAYAYKL